MYVRRTNYGLTTCSAYWWPTFSFANRGSVDKSVCHSMTPWHFTFGLFGTSYQFLHDCPCPTSEKASALLLLPIITSLLVIQKYYCIFASKTLHDSMSACTHQREPNEFQTWFPRQLLNLGFGRVCQTPAVSAPKSYYNAPCLKWLVSLTKAM